MVPVLSLWLPILLSAVLVFIASSIIHMALGYHASDYVAIPTEEEVMESLRRSGVGAGDYAMPYAGSMKEMSDPLYVEKTKRGPVAFVTVAPSGPPAMGKQLTLWFVYSVLVSIFAAYVAGRALAPGADYLEVFRFVGTTAFVGYAVGQWQQSIWYFRKWSTTAKNTLDGLIYGLLTAGVFGWLWPS